MARETLIQMRQGSASAWTSANPILAVGELGVITDNSTIKVGNGSSEWISLSGYLPNTAASNTFTAGQVISPKTTSSIGLSVFSGMRYAFITSALFASNGAEVTYTYATNGGGLGGGLISVGDYVTVTGFSNSTFNYTNAQVTGVTVGQYPTFTIAGSGTPSSSATGNSNTWFYETTTGMANLQRWSYTGPGGSAGSTSTTVAASITANGAMTLNSGLTSGGTVSGVNLTANGGSIIRTALAGQGSSGATFNDSGALIRTTSSERYKQDIVAAEYSYEDILSLEPKVFRLKEEVVSNENARIYGGFIAEDLDKLESLRVFVNYKLEEDGSKVPDGINYGEMVSALVVAIKKQDSIITALTARIETLEKKVK